MPAPDGVRFLMDVPGRVIWTQNKLSDVCLIEMEHARFVMIYPDNRRIVQYAHEIVLFC